MVNTETRLIMLFDREALYSLQKKKKRTEAESGSNHELFIAS